MTGFRSPLTRKSALALTLMSGALSGWLSARTAQAQAPQFDPNLYCSQNYCGGQSPQENSNSSQFGKTYLDTFNRIMNQPSQTLSPKVTEQDAYELFSLTVNSVENGFVIHSAYDLDAQLRGYYHNAADDKTKALAVAFSGMGGLQKADQAGREAVGSYRNWYEPVTRNTEYAPDPSIKKKVTDKYTLHQVMLNGRKISYAEEIASSANDLLAGARRHGMNFTDYMNKVFLSHKFSDPKDLSIRIQTAARQLGLGWSKAEAQSHPYTAQ